MTTPSSPPNEGQMLALLKVMDREAWSSLFENYTGSLRTYVNWQASNHYQSVDEAACEDIIQQTWMTAIENIAGFEYKGEGRLYPWIRTIAYNHLRNAWRQTLHAAPQSFEGFEDDYALDTFLHENGLFEDSMESKTLRRERMLALDAALRELNAKEREIVIRRFFWNEKPQELAEAYGLIPQSVSAIITKAKKKIYLQLITHDLFGPSGSYSVKEDD